MEQSNDECNNSVVRRSTEREVAQRMIKAYGKMDDPSAEQERTYPAAIGKLERAETVPSGLFGDVIDLIEKYGPLRSPGVLGTGEHDVFVNRVAGAYNDSHQSDDFHSIRINTRSVSRGSDRGGRNYKFYVGFFEQVGQSGGPYETKLEFTYHQDHGDRGDVHQEQLDTLIECLEERLEGVDIRQESDDILIG